MSKYAPFTICLLIVIVAVAGIPGVSAMAPDTRLRIDPANLVVDLNEAFIVNVVIEEANNLAAFEFDLIYDPAILQVTEVAVGDFLESTGNSAVAMGPEVNHAEGRTTFGAVSFGGKPGVNGTGVLATINCVAQREGRTTLGLQEVQVLDTAASVQQVTVEDGQVMVGDAAAATPIATTPTATDLSSPTSTGASSWVVPALILAALAVIVLAVFILSRRSGD